MNKIIIATAITLAASTGAFAQSAYTGTATAPSAQNFAGPQGVFTDHSIYLGGATAYGVEQGGIDYTPTASIATVENQPNIEYRQGRSGGSR